MQSIPLENAMILWTRTSVVGGPSSRFAATVGKVEIVQHPPGFGSRSKQFQSSYGACNFEDWRKPEERLLRLFIAFNTLTAREGMDPKVTHEAFLAIPEYRQNISPEQFGATYIDEEDVERLKRSESPFNQTNLEATRGKQEAMNA